MIPYGSHLLVVSVSRIKRLGAEMEKIKNGWRLYLLYIDNLSLFKSILVPEMDIT
jgi:hypothetical protein